ncbi:hypothetical protein THRCLA_20780 [Thraustotheca clavata]|uniref:BZIP domain-containing protein n=1 Tax=Thraustotheca clavata TaxID=74557 RepID=A0A1W0A3L6_9STRA|nr:hypothetical protein THRCLA_20780 [Thraustotheca clavata]
MNIAALLSTNDLEEVKMDGDDSTPSNSGSNTPPLKDDEKRNRHRLSNMRHRKRKNMEIDALRRRAKDLEAKRDQLKAASSSVTAMEGPWEELCGIERSKLALARDEHTVLTKSVQHHEDIIKQYYHSNGIDEVPSNSMQ